MTTETTTVPAVKQDETLEKVSAGVLAFEAKKQEFRTFVEESKKTPVAIYPDKSGYEKMKRAAIDIRNLEIPVEKDGLALRNMIKEKLVSVVSEKEKEILNITKDEKARLVKGREDYEKEEARVKAEEDRKEKERIQARIDQLAGYGVTIDYLMVMGFTDEQFSEKLNTARIDFEAEQERIAKEAREAAEAKAAEEARIKAEREELEKLRAEQAEREAKMKAEADKLAAERKAIEDEKARIEREKQAAIDAENKRIADEKAAEQRRIEDERLKKAAAEKAIADQKAKEERERIAAERKAARQPDKIKLLNYAESIAGIPMPVMKTDEGAGVAAEIESRFKELVNFITQQAEDL